MEPVEFQAVLRQPLQKTEYESRAADAAAGETEGGPFHIAPVKPLEKVFYQFFLNPLFTLFLIRQILELVFYLVTLLLRRYAKFLRGLEQWFAPFIGFGQYLCQFAQFLRQFKLAGDGVRIRRVVKVERF